MSKYKNKYRSESARATWWNYGWAGAYFITICTKNRNHYFGIINSEPAPNQQENKMILSNCGILADIFWHQIPHHAKNIELGAFVVMPDHLHGILILTADSDSNFIPDPNPAPAVRTGHALSVQLESESQLSEAQKRFRKQGKNTISSIIGSYKSAVTKHANRLGFEFGWQTRFHDHIIRNDDEYQRINDYIKSNVDNWKGNKFF